MKKKLFQRARNILLILLTLIIGTYLGVRIWLGYRFDKVVEDLNYSEFVENINNTADLPSNVHEAYYKVFNSGTNNSTNELIAKIPLKLIGFEVNNEECPCITVNYGFVVNFWDRLSVGLQLDKDVGSQKCLNAYLENFDFLYGQIGISNASKYYYNLPIEELSEIELLELCIMTKNPSFYNKRTNSDILNNELKRIMFR